MDQFILFGDSITQQAFSPEGRSFGAALSNAYIRRLDVVNRGFSGYNTSLALEVLPKLMPSPAQAKVRIMTISFGANDSRLPNTPIPPQQHVPLDQFRANLRAIATHPCIHAHKDIRLILVTSPAVDERMLERGDQEAYGLPMLRRTSAATRQYADAVVDLGRELNLPVLNLWRAMAGGDSDGQGLLPGSKELPINARLQGLVRDGLHLSESGYALLYQTLMQVIEETWPELMPERLPFVWPAWDAIPEE